MTWMPAFADTSTAWGRFELPQADARRFFHRQLAWAGAQALVAVGLYALVSAALASPSPSVTAGLAMGLGAAATLPTRAHLLPLVAVAVLVGTVALAWIGVSGPLAAGLCAGLAVGRGGPLSRLEAALFGLAGAGLGAAIPAWLGAPGVAGVALTGLATGLLTAYALLPGAVQFVARQRIPSPGRIRGALAEPYRAPCLRAWQLDQELQRAAPDPDTREGLAEVAGWVYRLAVTLQTLDGDVQRIDPTDVAARQRALDADPTADTFVRERRASTGRHLAKLLEHRDALTAERARTAALQEYAVAWLEDARAGLALSRVLPGEDTPEQLDGVLDKLRQHATDRTAARRATQELAARPR